MKRIILLVLVLSLVFPVAASAQDDNECDVVTTSESVTELLAMAANLDDLIVARAALDTAIAECQDLRLESRGNNVFVVDVDSGVYLVELGLLDEGQTLMSIKVVVVDGQDPHEFIGGDSANDSPLRSTIEFSEGTYALEVEDPLRSNLNWYIQLSKLGG